MTAASPDRRAIITEALRKIDDLTARLEVAERADTEPIAVVGIGCRLPGGVNNADEYWRLLQDGASGVIRVPADRWDADEYYSADHTVPGTICNREGGFLTSWQPDEFDAEFFSISPREAAAMDPQHRLLLEVAWEALENAGIDPRALRGSQTGVFVGMTTSDYYLSFAGKLRRQDIDPYIPFGSAPNFAAGRLSYFLGVRGPAVVSDTACSSSLVSIHLACQSLRRRESDHALAAGVNLSRSPRRSSPTPPATTARPPIGSWHRAIAGRWSAPATRNATCSRLLLIAAAEKSGRAALARALLAERVELKPHSVASWLHYGDALDKAGDPAAAMARERAGRAARRMGTGA